MSDIVRTGGASFREAGLQAVEAFLSCDDRSRVDMFPQRWTLTQCPFGFLLTSKASER